MSLNTGPNGPGDPDITFRVKLRQDLERLATKLCFVPGDLAQKIATPQHRFQRPAKQPLIANQGARQSPAVSGQASLIGGNDGAPYPHQTVVVELVLTVRDPRYQAGLKNGNASQTPQEPRKLLNKMPLANRPGSKLVEEFAPQRLKPGWILSLKNDLNPR
ncbi:MAG: hypothetical protein JNL45_06875 [Hyphomicrobium sp.]|nr:hypothetical protein [Hyphomicrobium sp.]